MIGTVGATGLAATQVVLKYTKNQGLLRIIIEIFIKKIKLWKCKLCPYQNDEEPEVKKHLHLNHNIESDIVCPKCKKVFGQKNKLVKHIPLCGHKCSCVQLKVVEKGLDPSTL